MTQRNTLEHIGLVLALQRCDQKPEMRKCREQRLPGDFLIFDVGSFFPTHLVIGTVVTDGRVEVWLLDSFGRITNH